MGIGPNANTVYADENGAVTAARLQEICNTLTATATELQKLAGVTGGTTTASKALVVDSNKRLDTLVLGTLALGAGAGTAVSATADELNKLSGLPTIGTYQNSQVVVMATLAAASLALSIENTTGKDLRIDSFSLSGLGTIADVSLDCGIAATATTADTLIDGVNAVAANGSTRVIYSNHDNAGTNGKGVQLWPAGHFLTVNATAGTLTNLNRLLASISVSKLP